MNMTRNEFEAFMQAELREFTKGWEQCDESDVDMDKEDWLYSLGIFLSKRRIDLITTEPHLFREMVNAARDVAIKYHDHQSLRDRMSHTLSAFCMITPKNKGMLNAE